MNRRNAIARRATHGPRGGPPATRPPAQPLPYASARHGCVPLSDGWPGGGANPVRGLLTQFHPSLVLVSRRRSPCVPASVAAAPPCATEDSPPRTPLSRPWAGSSRARPTDTTPTTTPPVPRSCAARRHRGGGRPVPHLLPPGRPRDGRPVRVAHRHRHAQGRNPRTALGRCPLGEGVLYVRCALSTRSSRGWAAISPRVATALRHHARTTLPRRSEPADPFDPTGDRSDPTTPSNGSASCPKKPASHGSRSTTFAIWRPRSRSPPARH